MSSKKYFLKTDYLNWRTDLINKVYDLLFTGRGEFGDVFLAKLDLLQVKKLRNKDDPDTEPKVRPVMVKALNTKDEVSWQKFKSSKLSPGL